jgi:hypothetical protein
MATVNLSDDRTDGDSLTVSYSSAAFEDKNVDTGKTVHVSGISISGDDGDNYTFNTETSTTADITAKPLSIKADNMVKTYGRTITFAGTEFTVSGLVNGDIVARVNLNSDGAFASAGAGSYEIIAAHATGTGLANYNITYIRGYLTVIRVATSTDLTSSLNPSSSGQAVTSTPTVISPTGTPTGSEVTPSPATTAPATTTPDITGSANPAISSSSPAEAAKPVSSLNWPLVAGIIVVVVLVLTVIVFRRRTVSHK